MSNRYHELVKWALNQARRNLVDLSRRNRLLHAPLSGKRPWCMAIIGHSPDELFDKLYRQENFRGYAFNAYETDNSSEEHSSLPALPLTAPQSPKSARRPRLQTRLAAEKLEKRLTKIFREERTLAEEQGISTLFLGACPSNSGFCWPKKRESDSLPPHEQDIPRLEDR
jgi:hypothetical protein